MNTINKFFIHRPILSYIILCMVIFLGYRSYLNLPKRQYPLIYSNTAKITTRMPNALSEEIEQMVTIPLEKSILKIPGVHNVTSTSRKGISKIYVPLKSDVPVEEIMESIHRTVSSTQLPKASEQPIVTRRSVDQIFMRIVVFDAENKKTLFSAAQYIKNTIEKIPSIEKAQIVGVEEERITIELSPKKLLYYELSVLEIVNTIKANQYQVSCGVVNSDKGKIYVNAGKSMENITELENILLRSNFRNSSLRLKDVGRVFYEFPEPENFERYNGSSMLRVDVSCLEKIDALKISNYIHTLLPEFRKKFNNEISLYILWDKTNDIRRRIKILLANGIWGSIIVFFLIVLFMNFRSLFLIALGVLFSFCGLLICMKISSMSINVVSLFGMIVVLGMLVDDSILISENINRHLMNPDGSDIQSKILNGVREMSKPVTLTVLTTIVAFYPLTYLHGTIGRMARDIPMVVIFALACSLFEALFLMPSHMIEMLNITHLFRRNPQNSPFMGEKKWFEKFRNMYLWLLEKSLKWRYLCLCAAVLLFGSSYYIFQYKLKYSPFPQDTATDFFINVKVNNTTELLPLIKKIENHFLHNPFDGFVGIYTSIKQKDYYYKVKCTITCIRMESHKLRKIAKKHKQELQPLLDKYSFNITEEAGDFSEKIVSLNVKGTNFHILNQISEKIQQFISTLNGINSTEDDLTEEHKGLSIKINELAAYQSGINYKDIAQSLKYLMGENEILILPLAKQEQSVNIRLKNKDHIQDFPNILKQLIKTKTGRLIPLSQLITYSVGSGITQIKHQDGYRSVKIKISFDNEGITAREIKSHLKQLFNHLITEYPGYSIEYGEEQKDVKKTMSSLQTALIVAIIIIFILLYLIFNSLIQPFIIMSVIPFGLASAVWALFLHGKPLSILAMLGMASLIGVIINDSVVFVDFINNHKKRFPTITTAVLNAGQQRFKQIILTTLTSLGGLLPLAYGLGGKDNILMQMAFTFCWGLGCGTLFTLFFVPYFYLVIEDIKKVCGLKKE